jgi:hypothetical protein
MSSERHEKDRGKRSRIDRSVLRDHENHENPRITYPSRIFRRNLLLPLSGYKLGNRSNSFLSRVSTSVTRQCRHPKDHNLKIFPSSISYSFPSVYLFHFLFFDSYGFLSLSLCLNMGLWGLFERDARGRYHVITRSHNCLQLPMLNLVF